MPSRFEYERAVRASELPPLSRLLALTIATWADVRTGTIPARLQPSLTTLEAGTGMARASVRTHLDKLETGGWLIRKRPTVAAARSKKATTTYKIHVPKGVEVPDSDGIELGQEMPPSRAGDALDDTTTRAGDAPVLGQEMPQHWGSRRPSTRAGAALSSSNGPETSFEYQQTGQDEPARIGDRPRIPEPSRPLVDALYNAGLITGWDLQPADWFLIEALIKRCGIPAMVISARSSWQGARTQPRNGNYFIPAWRKLADTPAHTEQQHLPAVVGDVLQLPNPGHRPSTTDARVQQAIDSGRRLQALADAKRAQEQS